MKVTVSYRTGGVERVVLGTGDDSVVMPATYKSVTESYELDSAEELLAKFPPLKSGDKLLAAIADAFAGRRDKVEYNFGRGNSLFYFH